MKRLFTLFISLLLLIVSVGFTVNTHFCKGKQQETSLLMKDRHEVCPICGNRNNQQHKKDSCCKYKTEHLKLTGKVQESSFKNSTFKFSGEVLLNRYSGAVFEYSTSLIKLQTDQFFFSTPVWHPPLYLMHCVYRI